MQPRRGGPPQAASKRGRKTISEKISAYSKEVLWEKSNSEGDEPASKRIAKTEDAGNRLPLEVAAQNGSVSRAGFHAGQHGLGQLPLSTSPHALKRHKAVSAGTAAAEAARLRPAPAQKPQAALLQGPDGVHGPLQDAAVQSSGPEPPAAAQGSAERLPSTSPPAAEPAHQLCMVPDTPVSDSLRDSAPDVQQWDVPRCALDDVDAPASLGLPLGRPIGISVGNGEGGEGTLQGWAAARLHSPDLQNIDGKADVRLPFAPESADDRQLGSAPQLVLDLQLSGTQSLCSEPQGVQSDPHTAARATPDPERAAAEAAAASLPAAALAPDDPLSGCLKQSGDRETPLVQCAQLAADLSTGDSSRRALAVRSALGAAQRGHQTPGPGSRPSLSPLLTRHIAFNSGGARIERRPSLLGAQPAGQQEGGQQALAYPGLSQGLRVRDRFLTKTGSQPGADTPVLQSPARPVSAPATAKQSTGALHAERIAYSVRGQQPLAAAALALDYRTANAGTVAHASVPGDALRKPVSATMYSSHLLRGTETAATAEQQHVLQQEILPGSSTPIRALHRAETLAASHRQPSRGTLPTPTVLGHDPHQLQQLPLLPDCSLPAFALGQGLQLAKPAAYEGSATAMQPVYTRPISAQGSMAAQRTHHQHISLKETYREPQHAASAHPAAVRTAMSADSPTAAKGQRTEVPALADEDMAGSEDNYEAELDGFDDEDGALSEPLSQSLGSQRRTSESGALPRLRSSLSYQATQLPTPAPASADNPSRKLAAYLPAILVDAYSEAGIMHDLYPWQAEALTQPGVLSGRNLVFTAPTSAGKSAVAEILMLRRLCEFKDKVCMLVLPFVSLCREKEKHIKKLLKPLHREVKGNYADRSTYGGIDPESDGVLVCTIEKANQTITGLLEEENMGHLSCIVVDELHMVGDQDRGYLLELMLTKLRYATAAVDENHGRGIQIVGMSATLSNAQDLAQWLSAQLFQTSFRPVELRKYVKIGRELKESTGQGVRVLEQAWEGQDPDHVALLCKETLELGKSVLIFCATKKGCSTTAKHVAALLGNIVERKMGGKDADALEETSRAKYIQELDGIPDKNPVLVETFPRGVAIHHGDLAPEERVVVEEAFSSGALRVLVATSTLSAGVNLPAARVIIRDHYMMNDKHWLSRLEVRQMAGRAGRSGFDTTGEAILIVGCKYTRQADKISKLIEDGHDVVSSCLTGAKRGMKRAMLEVVASRAVATAQDVKRYIKCTLLATTTDFESEVAVSTHAASKWLVGQRMIAWDVEQQRWGPTTLGNAVMASSMDPDVALEYIQDLERSMEGLNIRTDLHLCYLITPYNEILCRDWQKCYDVIVRLQGSQHEVGKKVGLDCSWLVIHGSSHTSGYGVPKVSEKAWPKIRVARRFGAALVLQAIMQEASMEHIRERYGVERKDAEELQKKAGKMAGAMAAFCERMGHRDLALLISRFQSRAFAGVKQDIVALTEIQHIGASSARKLFNEGLRTAEVIAKTSADVIYNALSKGADPRRKAIVRSQARNIRRSAQQHLKRQAQEQLGKVRLAKKLMAEATTQAPGATPAAVTAATNASSPAKSTPALTSKSPPASQLPSQKGMHLVEGGAALRQLAERWKQKTRWAFALVHSPVEPGAKGLALPPLPGALKAAGEAADVDLEPSISAKHRIAGIAVTWDAEHIYFLPASAETWTVLGNMLGNAGTEKLTYDWKLQLTALSGRACDAKGAALPGLACKQPIVDVRIAAWLVRPDSYETSDNPCPPLAGGRQRGIETLMRSRMGDGPEQSLKELARSSPSLPAAHAEALRACKHAGLIWHAYSHFRKALQTEGLMKAMTEVEMPLVHVLQRMEAVGIAVDINIFEKHRAPLERRIRELTQEVRRLSGKPKLNLGSSKELGEVLFGVLKLPVPHCATKGASKNPSTNNEVLEELAHLHELPRLMQEFRTLDKIHSDFVVPLDRRARRSSFGSPSTGPSLVRIRGHFCQTATATGRLSMEDPNLQTVPKPRLFDVKATQTQVSAGGTTSKRREHEANIRDAFVAPEGRVLLSADYAQMELRLMAHLSGDESLRAVLADPDQDPFTQWAAQWLRVTPITAVTPEKRAQAKQMAYGLLYGMGKHALARNMGVPPDTAQQLSDSFRASIPDLDKWMRGLVEACRRHRFVTTIGGRRRYLIDIDSADGGKRAAAERQAINSAVQGSAADVCKAAMVALHARASAMFADRPGACRLILQIHDELLLEVDKEVLPEVCRLVKECMEGAASLSVPMRVKLSVGPSWGQLEPYG